MVPLSLLLLTDSRFPAGGFAHSGGLEAAVESGLTAAEVPAFLVGRLRGVAGPEAILTVAAGRAARAADGATLAGLDLEAAARCPSPALRTTATRLGAQLLRTATAVWPGDPVLGAYREQSATTPRPIVFGVVAAAAGLGDLDSAAAYLYEEAAAIAAAAIRLLPVDGAAAVRLLLEAESEIERLALAAVAESTDPRTWPAGFAPALELGSLEHAAREGRLFAS
jgi:urease accessory protein